VQLLLDAHAARHSLPQALTAVDATGATPLQVACQKNKNAVVERASVARWDAVAGHAVADWQKCIDLLRKAERRECHYDDDVETSNNNHPKERKNTVHAKLQQQQKLLPLPEIPFSLSSSSSSRASCLVCPTTDDGKCFTSSWESQFWAALSQSTEQQLCRQASDDNNNNAKTIPADNDDSILNNNNNNQNLLDNDAINTTADQEEVGEYSAIVDDKMKMKNSANPITNVDDSSSNSTLPSSASSSSSSSPSSSLGRLCDGCRTQTFALYPSSTGGLLVCKKCQRKGRRR
jgi:hypothetical protein